MKKIRTMWLELSLRGRIVLFMIKCRMLQVHLSLHRILVIKKTFTRFLRIILDFSGTFSLKGNKLRRIELSSQDTADLPREHVYQTRLDVSFFLVRPCLFSFSSIFPTPHLFLFFSCFCFFPESFSYFSFCPLSVFYSLFYFTLFSFFSVAFLLSVFYFSLLTVFSYCNFPHTLSFPFLSSLGLGFLRLFFL